MVARILSGYSIRGLLDYNETKVESGDAKLILANRFAVEVEKLELRHKVVRFEKLTRLNGRAKRNALHIMLNFDRSDKLQTDKLIDIATTYMNGIGFGDQPSLVYRHHDVSHPHLHIITTNIKADGSRIDFHNIGKFLSELVRKQIEVDFGLTPSQGRGMNMERKINPAGIKPVTYGEKPTKQSIYNVVIPVLRSYAFTSLAEFNAVLRRFNVTADRGKEDSIMFERRGLVYSIINEQGIRVGVPIKASTLAGKPTLDRLEKKFHGNQIKKKSYKEPLKKSIDGIFSKYRELTKQTFVEELKANHIDLIFRRSGSGQIFGVTFVDHNSRCVFNGSDLGKEYSAKGILDKLGREDRLVSISDQIAASHFSETRLLDNVVHPDQNTDHPNTKELLELLLEKPAFDQSTAFGRKKKKKKQKRPQSISIKN